MIVLDATVVNVALPPSRATWASPSSLAWVVNAYLIAFGGLLLLAGRLGDLIGRRRVFLAGLAVFTIASLVCGLSAPPGRAGRRPLRPGRRRRAHLGGDPRDDRDDVPRAAASRPRRSASTPSSPRPAARSACWPAACSPRRSAGTGSSSSTSRSASPPACSRCGCSPPTAGIGLRQGADVPGALLITGALMLGVYSQPPRHCHHPRPHITRTPRPSTPNRRHPNPDPSRRAHALPTPPGTQKPRPRRHAGHQRQHRTPPTPPHPINPRPPRTHRQRRKQTPRTRHRRIPQPQRIPKHLRHPRRPMGYHRERRSPARSHASRRPGWHRPRHRPTRHPR